MPARNDSQFVVTLEVIPGRAAALVDAIQQGWGHRPVQLERPGHAHGWVEIYFGSDLDAALAEAALSTWPGVVGTARRLCRPRDWQEAWRRHFRAHNVGRRLRLCPVGSAPGKIPAGRKAVWINPGLSFGTGDHFTTRFCLEMIDQLCQTIPPESMMDVGTGSGILAIAAARLGIARVLGVDHDPLALAQARENVRRNRLAKQITLRRRDVQRQRMGRRFDLVCANLNFPVIAAAWPALRESARNHLVLSGLRESELDAVADRAAVDQAVEITRDGDGEWGGLLLEIKREKNHTPPRVRQKRRVEKP